MKCLRPTTAPGQRPMLVATTRPMAAWQPTALPGWLHAAAHAHGRAGGGSGCAGRRRAVRLTVALEETAARAHGAGRRRHNVGDDNNGWVAVLGGSDRGSRPR
jgi:hypothetical protein